MKKFLTTIVSAALAIAAYAVPAIPGAFMVIQPNGEEVMINLIGDEHFHYNTSEDGFLIVKNSTGFWNYAVMEENGTVSATEFVYHKPTLRSESEINFLENVLRKNNFKTIAEKVMIQRSEEHFKAMQISRLPQETNGLGERGIAILVNFSDNTFYNASTANARFTNLLNQQGYSENNSVGSARDYFIANSDSLFKPTFDVYGPYTLPQSMAYYGGNNAYGSDNDAQQMIIDACIAAYNAGVDFSLYDTDNNGKVDNVFVFYAGYAEAHGGDPNTIWPHRSVVSGGTEFNGIRIYDYACSSELRGNSGTRIDGIGTFCHEFSHVLGLPDYYNTQQKGGTSVLGSWNLMDTGCYNGPGSAGDVPCMYSAYDRFYVGWFTPTVLSEPSAETGDYTLYPMTSIQKNAFIVSNPALGRVHNLDPRNPNPNEFFILENRKLESWDRYLPNDGMLIWRINYSASIWSSNRVNVNKPYRCAIMAADEGAFSKYSYPGNSGNYKTYRFQGSNNDMWNNGVYNIAKNGSNITFYYVSDVTPIINPEIQQLKVAYANSSWIINLEHGNYQASLFSTTGQLISNNLFADGLVINNGVLASGTYIIVVNDLNNNKKYQAKVIK